MAASARLTSLSHDVAGTAHDVTTSFAYDMASQLTSSTRDNDAYAWTGHYNVDRAYAVNGLMRDAVIASITSPEQGAQQEWSSTFLCP